MVGVSRRFGNWAGITCLLAAACRSGPEAPSTAASTGASVSADADIGSTANASTTTSRDGSDGEPTTNSDSTTSGGPSPTTTSVGTTDATTTASPDPTDPTDEGEASTGTDELGPPQITETHLIADVWSGHPVAFALATHEDSTWVAYYDADRRLTVARRSPARPEWETIVLPSTVGWDSHNSIAMAIDGNGDVHVSGNMHNVPLIYFRTRTPLDPQSFEAVPSMVGRNESSCTYPEFFFGPSGDLVFAYRDGGSGNGNHIFNRYDLATRTWTRLLDTPLTDGQGQRNAYPVGPTQGPDGYWHLVWVWRDTPDAATNHNLSYARTQDLVQWQSGAGSSLPLPITLAASDIVDPVPAGGGMINNNTKVGFDDRDRPVVVYHKYDLQGNTQLYNARFEDGAWVVHQTSQWDHRWDFGGNGTLIFEIEVDGVKVQPDGRLTQEFYHAQYGGWGAFVLDPETLAAIETIDPPRPYPLDLDLVTSTTPGMEVRWQADFTPPASVRAPYSMLRWETLPSNRDMPRDTIPPPTPLRLYTFAR